jgi:hypothetical protein
MAEAHNQAAVDSLRQAINNHDLDSFFKLVSADYSLHAAQSGELLQGQDEVRAFFDMLFTAFPDLVLLSIWAETSRQMVYQKVEFHGTHLGLLPMPDRTTAEASGKAIALPVEMFHYFDAERAVASTTVYVALVPLAGQLGQRTPPSPPAQ